MMSRCLGAILLPVILALLIGRESGWAQGAFLNPYPQEAATDHLPPAVTRSRRAARSTLAATGEVALPIVRLAYIIPSNRTAQANGAANIGRMALKAQNWFRDQMRLHGFEGKTFRLEMESDGTTPRVHAVQVAETDDYLRGDLWGRTQTAATQAGLSIWADGEIWVLLAETHLQKADSSVIGGTAVGSSFGSGTNPGLALMGGDVLARFADDYLSNDASFGGTILSAIGQYPLKSSVSFPWFEGSTFSSIASAAQGAFIHELTHALGLPHDFRSDANYHGNLMGNGLRGLRGCFHPARYASDTTDLSLTTARVLDTSRYFNAETVESVPPTLSWAATSDPVDGKLSFEFQASDASGLASAMLLWKGDLVADQKLSGTSSNGRFSTSYFTAGMANNYQIFVYDRFGNRQSASISLSPKAGAGGAPIPYLKISTPLGLPGETVTLDASGSTDPVFSTSSLTVRWDLDGDGVFETLPTSSKTLLVNLNAPGTRAISVEVTDPDGLQSIAGPLYLHTEKPTLAVSSDAATSVLQTRWISRLGFGYLVEKSSDLKTWTSSGAPYFTGTSAGQTYETPLMGLKASWVRLRVSKRFD